MHTLVKGLRSEVLTCHAAAAAARLAQLQKWQSKRLMRSHADLLDKMRAQIAQAYIARLEAFARVMDEELEQVWAGKKTAKEALDAAVKRGNEQLERFQQANKG